MLNSPDESDAGSRIRPGLASITSVLTVVLLSVTPAWGQLNSVPVIYAPPPPELAGTFTGYLFLGRGGDDDSGENTAPGVVLSRGFGQFLTVSVGGGVLWPENSQGNREFAWQAMASVQYDPVYLTDGETHDVTVGLLTGAGYTSLLDSAWEVNIPVAVGGALIHNFPGIGLEQWIAPRYGVRFARASGETAIQGGVGLSAGVNVGFPSGLGIYMALDWSKRNQKTVNGVLFPEAAPFVWAVGVRKRF